MNDKKTVFYRTLIGAVLMICVCAPLFWRYGAGYGALMLVIGGMMGIAALIQFFGLRKSKKEENDPSDEKNKNTFGKRKG